MPFSPTLLTGRPLLPPADAIEILAPNTPQEVRDAKRKDSDQRRRRWEAKQMSLRQQVAQRDVSLEFEQGVRIQGAVEREHTKLTGGVWFTSFFLRRLKPRGRLVAPDALPFQAR
jgi:hypothetical protein